SQSTPQHAQTAVDKGNFDVSQNPSASDDSLQNLEKATVKQLRELLANRSLKTSGVKSELIARLQSSKTNSEIKQFQDFESSASTSSSSRRDAPDDSRPLSAMTVKELRSHLSDLGLSQAGSKNELMD